MVKKEKKNKHQEPQFVLGKKIRDVKINEKQHFLLFISMLLLVNILLLASVWFVLIYLNRWYNWVVCIGLLAVAFGISFKTYRDTKVFNRCALHTNAIVVNSIWFNLKIELKDIIEMNVKVSSLDKIFNLNTKSLEVKILNHRRHKFTLHFIEESAVKLKQEITILIDKYEKEKNQPKSEEKTSAN